MATSTQTSFIAKRVAENQATAENIIRNQVDYTLSQDFKAPGESYDLFTDDPAYPALPPGYSVTAVSEAWPDNDDVTLVRIEVWNVDKLVRSFETLRTDR